MTLTSEFVLRSPSLPSSVFNRRSHRPRESVSTRSVSIRPFRDYPSVRRGRRRLSGRPLGSRRSHRGGVPRRDAGKSSISKSRTNRFRSGDTSSFSKRPKGRFRHPVTARTVSGASSLVFAGSGRAAGSGHSTHRGGRVGPREWSPSDYSPPSSETVSFSHSRRRLSASYPFSESS